MGDDFDAAVEEAGRMAVADQKLESLVRLRESVLKERRLLRVLTCLSIVLALVAIGLGRSAKNALDEFETSRAEARMTACLNANEQQARSIEANEAQLRVVFEATGRVRTPEEQAQLEVLYEKHDKVIEDSFPMRDCSSQAAIDAYYEGRK